MRAAAGATRWPARRAVQLSLLVAAVRGCCCNSLNEGLSFTIDERHGGIRNNPNLIVFIVLLSMGLCACGMCAIGFGKWDWLRVLIKGEDPNEVDLLGAPPPEPQGGGGNWVVRPRMETPLDDDGGRSSADGRSQYSGWGGGSGGDAYGSERAGDAKRAEELPPDASPEAAAAWLLRQRGRPLAAPPAVAVAAAPSVSRSSGSSSWSEDASTAPSEPLPRSSDATSSRRSGSRRTRRSRESPSGADSGAQPQQQPLPAEVAEAQAFVAFAHRRPVLPSPAPSGSSFWSRSRGSGDTGGGLWARLRGGGAAAVQPPPPAPERERRRRSRSRRDAEGRRLPPDERV
jgi:hypothetical protein